MGNKLIENIFSIKNDNDKKHKVITLFSAKIKIKSYKLMCKKLEKKYINLAEKNKRYLEAIKTNPEMYELYVRNPNMIKLDEERYPIGMKMVNEILSKSQMPLFYLVEIETINKCNGECDFCPVNKYDDPRELKIMDKELFYSIIQQLKELGYQGRVSLYSNNEPLLDKRIFEFVEYAKKELKKAHIALYSNTLLLDIDKFKKLVPYLDTFVLDIYYSDEVKISDKLKQVLEYCIENKELQKKVKVQIIDRHAIRNNRGGKSKNRKNVYALKTPCLHPFTQVIIRPDGKLSLCCNDGTADFTMGDLTKDKLIDIWRNDKYKEIRNKLKVGRHMIDKCKYCDAFGGFGINANPAAFTEKQIRASWDNLRPYLYPPPTHNEKK